jgi:hypothetical protein
MGGIGRIKGFLELAIYNLLRGITISKTWTLCSKRANTHAFWEYRKKMAREGFFREFIFCDIEGNILQTMARSARFERATSRFVV